jgi:hypothetical protein
LDLLQLWCQAKLQASANVCLHIFIEFELPFANDCALAFAKHAHMPICTHAD